MYQYSRTVTIKNGASMMPALKAAAEVSAYLNKVHNLQMQVGTEMFNELRVHWICKLDSLDSLALLNSKLAQDKAYWDIMDKIKPYVLEGSVQDKAIALMG